MADDTDLESEVRRLRSEVEALHRRVGTLEEATGTEPSSTETDDSDAPSTTAEGDDGVEASAEERASHEPRDGHDWERNLGIRWLGLIGGVALVVGVVFFVRLAIEAGWLGPLGRVLAGTIGGLALFAGGRFAAERQGYVRWGRIAAGAGLAVAYFSLYAAYGFESYRDALGTPLWVVLLALTLLVAATAIASVRDRAPIVAGEAFLLGYVTAYLGMDSATFAVTPAYVLLLAVGLVAIATVRPWSGLVISSVVPTYGVVGLWIADSDPASSVVAGVVVAAFGVYLAGGYVLGASERADRWHPIALGALTVLNAGIAAFLLEITARNWFPESAVEGVAPGMVALALAGFYVVSERRPVRRDDVAGTLAVVLLAVGVALAAGTFATTVGLLAIACGSFAVAARTGADAIRTGGHLVAAGTAYKLLVVDTVVLPGFDAADPIATLTGRAGAFALAIAVFYGLAWWFRADATTLSGSDREFSTAAPYAWTGTGLFVLVLWLELSGLWVTVAWAALGLSLVGIGITTDLRGLRLQGVAVLGFATAKVFLYDTRDLDALARTLSFLVLGAILLATSYAYARWQGEDPLTRLSSE